MFLFVTFLLIVLFAFVSAIGSITVGKKIENYQKRSLISVTETAALSIDPALVTTLEGTQADTVTPEYIKLKARMAELKRINKDARFVYLMGLRPASDKGTIEEKLFFYVDSEPENSEGYSAPGDIYEETTQEEITHYYNKTSFIQGPYEDGWGHWVTAETPIIDPLSGTTVAVLGVDISTKTWRSEILFARVMIAVSAALLTIFLLTLYLYIERSLQKIEILAKNNKVLQVQKTALVENEEVAGLGRFTLLLGSGTMTWDTTMYALFGIKEGEKINRELFESLIVENDRPKVKHLLDSLAEGNEDRGIIEYKVHVVENERTILSILKAYVGPDGNVTRIVGTSQDVSAKKKE